jgi:hypothetical protein
MILLPFQLAQFGLVPPNVPAEMVQSTPFTPGLMVHFSFVRLSQMYGADEEIVLPEVPVLVKVILPLTHIVPGEAVKLASGGPLTVIGVPGKQDVPQALLTTTQPTKEFCIGNRHCADGEMVV